MAGPDTERPTRPTRPTRGTRVDLGVAYGLIAGAAFGALLMALTGDVMWVSIGPGIGLALGLVVAGLLAHRVDGPAADGDREAAGDDDVVT